MAATRVPTPGTQYGPCAGPCTHIDCGYQRETAENICHFCSQPIGYETDYYRDPEDPDRDVHAACFEKHVEELR